MIELILFMGLFSILIFVIADIFVASLNAKITGESTAYVVQDSRFILSKFANDLNNANSIVSPPLGNSSSTLDFILYGQPEEYRLNNNNLELVIGSNAYVLNGQNTQLTSLTFQTIASQSAKTTVRINFTIQSKELVDGTTQVINSETTIGLR